MDTSDTNAIGEIIGRCDDAWNHHDMAAFADLFSEQADFVNVRGSHWKSRAEIERELSKLHQAQFKDSVQTIRGFQIQCVQAGVALVHIEWGMRGDRDADGTPRQPRQGIYTWVMAAQDGEWRIRASHNTNVLTTPTQ
jgi:uncharacterized protein (TIGR02246 family)